MELERMRELLATKAMGWELDEDNEQLVLGRKGGEPFLVMQLREWHPWDNWPQAGMVIETMRLRGWDCNIWIDARGWSSVACLSWSGETLGEAKCPTFTEAVSLAVARALESEATDG